MADNQAFDETRKAEWDARQLFARDLQDIDRSANEFKMRLELRDGSPEEMVSHFKMYFAYIRTLFRMMNPFFNKADRERIKNVMNETQSKLDSGMVTSMKQDGFPSWLETQMEDLHNEANLKRFSRGLIVPMSMPKADSLTAGWDDGNEIS
jgi:hypothetical protein